MVLGVKVIIFSPSILSDFKSGNITLDKTNAISIRDAIDELHKGIDKIEIDANDLKKVFNRPFTPDEAIDQFNKYIQQISKGKVKDKIRIIIK